MEKQRNKMKKNIEYYQGEVRVNLEQIELLKMCVWVWVSTHISSNSFTTIEKYNMKSKIELGEDKSGIVDH